MISKSIINKPNKKNGCKPNDLKTFKILCNNSRENKTILSYCAYYYVWFSEINKMGEMQNKMGN